jgi:hypothetical protein
MGLFTSDYTNHELVEVVRAVALHVSPRRPKTVSMRQFDAARGPAGHPHAPRSSRICERLDMTWPEVKELALNETRNVEQTLASRLAVEMNPKITLDDAFLCLRAVSSRLGNAPLDPALYDRERAVILAENRRSWRNGREIVFPTANQVAALAGGFAAACKQAGVESVTQRRPLASRWTWTDEELIEALVRLMDEYPGIDITQRNYRKLRAGRPEFPPVSSFNNAGRPGLKAYRLEAQRRRRKRKA